jgi:hypothetical protein
MLQPIGIKKRTKPKFVKLKRGFEAKKGEINLKVKGNKSLKR